MKKPIKNPAQCFNTATGQPNRLGKQPNVKSPKKRRLVKPGLSFVGQDGLPITIKDKTRKADVAVKLVLAGTTGISANDFDKGVRLGGLICELREQGMPISTTVKRVANDPFGAIRAVYRTTVRTIDKVQP